MHPTRLLLFYFYCSKVSGSDAIVLKGDSWIAHTKWWLWEVVTDGSEGGVYEITEPANGRLSRRNAWAVIVDKIRGF